MMAKPVSLKAVLMTMMVTMASFTLGSVIAGSAIVGSANAEEARQASWVGDVPIMPTLSIEQGLGFAFDSPEGRIVIIYLNGDTTAAEINAYYNNALKPLGWDAASNNASDNKWRREGETLRITTTMAADVELWKLTIRPE